MDILSLINDVMDDVSVADTKQGEPHTHTVKYTIKRDAGIDIETLRKSIMEAPILRPTPSYTFAEFRQPTPEHPWTATEMVELARVSRTTGFLSVPRRAWQDEVRAWRDRQTPYEPYDMIQTPLQPLRLEPEEVCMMDNPTINAETTATTRW